jgi:hypothetical protein
MGTYVTGCFANPFGREGLILNRNGIIIIAVVIQEATAKGKIGMEVEKNKEIKAAKELLTRAEEGSQHCPPSLWAQ